MGSGTGEKEGVIKFKSIPKDGAPASDYAQLIKELDRWRSALVIFSLLGIDDDGTGYGNLSSRVPGNNGGNGLEFIITASQTGHLADLLPSDYVHVTKCFPERNRVYYAKGTGNAGHREPSSETMTHFAVYAETGAEFVFHLHSKTIWDARSGLHIPSTPANVPYGTPAMAAAMKQLLSVPGVAEGKIIAMGGHPGGIIAWGNTANEAGLKILEYYSDAARLAAHGSLQKSSRAARS